MSGAYIIRSDGSTEVDFDGVESETHPDLATATEHPIEAGSTIVDHVRMEPGIISLVVLVSNTPLRGGSLEDISVELPSNAPPFDGTPGALWREGKALFSVDGPTTIRARVLPAEDRIADRQLTLDEIRLARELVAVVTMSRIYYDCVLIRSELARTAPGLGVFSLDFRRVDIVQTASVAAPVPLEPRGAPKVSKGSQAAKAAQAADAKKLSKSFAAQAADSDFVAKIGALAGL